MEPIVLPVVDTLGKTKSLDKIAKPLKKYAEKAIPQGFVKDFLNGTWLGHPLHPVLTDIPVGAWVITAIFDIIWLISPVSWAWAARGAEVTVIIGILGALGAAATGFADWSDTYGSERSVGLNHAIFNSSALLLYIISLVLRLTQSSGDSIAAAIVGFIGLGVMTYAAYLGGEMV